MLNPRLEYLHEVAIQGSMCAASEKLGVAVSSVSRQLAKLEKDLGIALLERAGRSVRLTEAGEVALAHYRDRVASEESFEAHIGELKGSRVGRVAIACGEVFLGKAISELIVRWSSDSPGASIHIRTGTTNEIIRCVVDDEVHMGVMLQIPAEPKIRVRATLSQPIKALVHPRHPLAAQRQVSLRAMTQHRLCLPERGFRLRQIIGQAEAQDGISLNAQLASNSLALLKDLVRTGSYATLLPDFAAMNELSNGELISIPIASPSLENVSANLVCRLGRQLSGIPARVLGSLESALHAWGAGANQPVRAA